MSGAATLRGTLNVSLTGGYGPLTGQVFQVVGSPSLSGSFSTINVPTDAENNPLFGVATTSTSVTLTALETAADLSPTAISVSPSVLVGQPLTVNYTVSNLQAAGTVAGTWTDSVYLSADGAIDSSSVLLGTVPQSGAVAGNGTYNGTLTVPTPAVLPGNYQIVVQVDSGNQVPDSNRANSAVASSGTVSVNYLSVSPGNPAASTVQPVQDLYYEVDPPAGSDVMLTAQLAQAGAAQVFVSQGAIPTPTTYQFVATANGTTLTLPILDSGAGPYFVLVQGEGAAGASTPFVLSLRQLGFEIVGIGPSAAPAVGTTNLTITGSHFTSNTTVSLVSPSGTVITPTAVSFENSNTLVASFDLDGVTPEIYSVQISDSGRTFTDPLAFTVAPTVQTLPETISSNLTLFSGVVYVATGNVVVNSGMTLTVQPGAIIKFAAGSGLIIDSGATLSAIGTVAQPIVFTSLNDDANGGDTNGKGNATQPAPGDWNQILNEGTATFDYAQVLYGSGVNNTGLNSGAVRNQGGTLTFTNGLISQALYDGFDSESTSATITNSVITSADRGIVCVLGGSISVINCTLDDNRIGIDNHNSGLITLTNSIVTNSLGIGVYREGGTLQVNYSDVYSTVPGSVNYSGMADPTGTNGDISADPKYVDPANGDYRLNYLSPAIDSANATVAPPADQAGDPLYNDPRTNPKTGIPNSSGLYADMGAFNFAESAPSTIDLAASNVVGPAAAVAGQSATITWTENNFGSTSAVGGWHDEIDLVLDPGPNQTVISAGDVLVATNTTLGPNQSLNLSATVTVPGGVPGDYYWQVVPDATGDVFEGQNQGTGVGLSALTTALSLPALAVNGAATLGEVTTAGQTVWYEVTPSDSKDVLLSLNSQAASGDIELYAAQGYIPTPSNFQFKSQEFDSPDPTLLIPAPEAGTPYYVIAYGRTLNSSSVPFTLSAATPQFSLTGASPGSIGNDGPATITISGGQLGIGDTYQLVGPGGTFTASQVQVQDSSTVFATFNLNSAATGAYSVMVTPQSGAPATLSGAVNVEPTHAASLSLQLLTPPIYRAGRAFQGEIVYENTGNVDMAAPLLDVTTSGQAELSLDGTNFSTSDLQLMGVSFNGPAGVLRPGQQWSIPFRVLSTSQITVPLQVNYELASDSTPMNYSAFAAAVDELGYDNTDTNAALTYFEQQAGPTMGGVVSELDQYASYVASVGNPQFDSESTVFSYAIHGSLEEATASATGIVYLGDTDHPLAGAEIILTNEAIDPSGNTTGTASGGVSNPDGSFIVDDLPPGTYNVEVDGYLLPNPVQVTVPTTGAATGLSIVVTAGGSISGTIVSQLDNSDISGTTVVATNTSDDSTYQATTDANGNYDITGLPDGTYNLTVGGDPWETQYVGNLQITNASTIGGENFTLAPGATVQGQVVANGVPVAGATVDLADANGNITDATTDANGDYSINGLSASTYTEQVTAPDFGPVQVTLPVAAGANVTAPSISLSAGDTITVTTVDSSSIPITEGTVELSLDGKAVGISSLDAQGQATFPNLDDGTYQLSVSAPGYLNISDTVTVAGGATITPTYTMQQGGTIQGTVVDGNGAPISGITVNMSGQDTGGNTYNVQVTTAANGTYQVLGAQPGTYILTVGNSCGIDQQQVTISESSLNSTVNFALAGAVIQGTVVAADGATPVANAQVYLLQNGQTLAEADTDSTGAYTLRGLAQGAYTLVASANQQNSSIQGISATETVSVAGNAAVTADGLVLGNQSLLGTVVTATGQPVPGALIALLPLNGTTFFDTDSAADGTFNIGGLAPGQYTLTISTANYAPLTQTVSIPSSGGVSQSFFLSTGIGVSGVISDQTTGQPLGQGSVIFFNPTTNAAVATAVANAVGQFVVPNLSPGTYNVIAYAAGYQMQEITAVTVNGNPFTINLALPAATTGLQGVVTDASGLPLANTSISVVNSLGESVLTLLSNGIGAYSTTALAPGTYTVEAVRSGYYSAQAMHVTVSNGTPATVNLGLIAAATDDSPVPVQVDVGSGTVTVGTAASNQLNQLAANLLGIQQAPSIGSLPVLSGDPRVSNPLILPPFCAAAKKALDKLNLANTLVLGTYQHAEQVANNGFFDNAANIATVVGDVANFTISLLSLASPAGTLAQALTKFTGSALTSVGNAGAEAQALINASTLVGSVLSTAATLYYGGPPSPGTGQASFATNVLSNAATALGLGSAPQLVPFLQKLSPTLRDLAQGVGPAAGFAGAAFGLISTILDFKQAFDGFDANQMNLAVAYSAYADAVLKYQQALSSYLTINRQCPPNSNFFLQRTILFYDSPGPKNPVPPGHSTDPNDLESTGFGPQGFVAPSDPIGYQIDFQNDPTATLPAQQVIVTDPLPSTLNWSTVQLTGIGFNGVTLSIPAGVSNYTTTTTVSTDPTHPVDINVTFDPTTGLLTWTMTSIDPVSGTETQDPLAGFLPPDNSQQQGEGFVTFTAQPVANLTTGTTITNQATVVFDTNAPINTPTATNTIDSGVPTSSVSPLPATEPPTFTVNWSGQDDVGGSGIAFYNVFVSDNGGAYTLFQNGTTQTSATFTGQVGHTYSFYSVATDNVGNVQPTPTTAQATTTVVNQPQIAVSGNSQPISDGSTTPSATNDTAFGSTPLGSSISETYTITNSGTAALSVGTVSIGGTNAGDFKITAQPSASVAVGGSTTFTVQFTPTAAGTRTATVSFSENDPTANSPFIFAVSGLATAPQIAVSGNSQPISDGSTTPSATNDTAFGSTPLGSSISETYTITNSGTAALSVGTVSIGGTNAGDFKITAQPSASVAVGGSTTFTVQFTPTAAGTRTATVSFSENDPTANSPFIFAVSGAATAQARIGVTGNGKPITDGSNTPSATNDTALGSTSFFGSPISETYTITNSGTAPLSVGTVTIGGADAGLFAVTQQPSHSVAVGGSTTFTVQFTPWLLGTSTATIRFSENDPSQTSPFTFAVSAVTTIPEPHIGVTGNSQPIADDSTTTSATNDTAFGTTPVGTSLSETYTITNSGTAPLLIGFLSIGGANAADFKITQQPSLSVSAGQSTTFTVEFTPKAGGTRSATVSIWETDFSQANPFTFAVSGVATSSRIAVTGNSQPITDGSTTTSASNDTAFGSTPLGGSPLTETYKITNSGTAPLTVGTVTIGGANAGDFTVTSQPAASVPVGGSTTFTVKFAPTAGGTRTATVHFGENDPSQADPFTFAISGVATTQAYIGVTGNGKPITDGSTTTSATNDTALGSAPLGAIIPLSETYTITNSGTGALTLGTVTIGGTNAGDFKVTQQPNHSVAVGGSTTFTVEFEPTAVGTRSATISFPQNDPNQANPFTFAISGVATKQSVSTFSTIGGVSNTSITNVALAVAESGSSPATNGKTASPQTSVVSSIAPASTTSVASANASSIKSESMTASITASTLLTSPTTKNQATDAALSDFDLADLFV